MSLVRLSGVPLARITRSRRAWLPIAAWFVFAILLTVVSPPASGADRILRGSFGALVVPLLVYGVVGAALGGAGLRTTVRGLVVLGASPTRAALASILLAMAASAVLSGTLAALVCVLAHGPADPPLARDLPASFGVASLGGATYAAYFSAGAAFARRFVRGLFLVADWVLGAAAGLGALFTPRGHVMSLLGGPSCFELSRRASSVALVVLALFYLALAVRLGRRSR